MEGAPVLLADARADLEEALFAVLGVPFDGTATFRSGAREGPAAIRWASYNFETWLVELGVDMDDVMVHDAGDLGEAPSPGELVDAVASAVLDLAGGGSRIPVLLGGEHTATAGAVRAVAGYEEDLSLLVLDAHLDYRDEYMGERASHACAVRRSSEVVTPSRSAVLGFRSASREELEAAGEDGLAHFTADSVREEGLEAVLDRALGGLGDGPLYLSIDLDVLDPFHAPAVQNPEPWGLSPLDVRSVVDAVADRVVGMDLMECAPRHDGGQTAIVAARLLRHAMGAVHLARR